jgi:hypothetical protein
MSVQADLLMKKAARIVDKYGAINISGIYGSIEVDELDFIPLVLKGQSQRKEMTVNK